MLSDFLAKLDPKQALAMYEEFGIGNIGNHDLLNRDESLFQLARIMTKIAPEEAVELTTGV